MWRILILGTLLSVVLATLCRAEVQTAVENTVDKDELVNVRFFLNKESCSLNDEVRVLWKYRLSVKDEVEDYDDLESYGAEERGPLCPIPSVKERKKCCEELYKSRREKTKKKKTKKCLEAAKDYFDALEKETLHLEEDAKEYVEGTLEKLEEAVASEQALEDKKDDGTEEDSVVDDDEDDDEDDDDDNDELDDKYGPRSLPSLTAQDIKTKKRRGMKRALRRYLRTMKKAERAYARRGQKGVPKKVRKTYRVFRDKLRMWYDKQLMGVFFKAVTQKWMACTMVSLDMESMGYCTDLELIDKTAKQLKRKAVLGYEAGRVSQLLEGANTEEVVRKSGRGQRRNARQQATGKASVRTSESSATNVMFVNLLPVDDSSCLSADLSYSCYAICCDSMYHGSFFCQSTGQMCLG